MNWNLIKEKYPESFHLAKWFWLGQTHLEPFEEFNIVPRMRANPRFLYDFFDEQGIHIRIEFAIAVSKLTDEWSWFIAEKHRIYGSNGYEFKTRTEAEEQAFLRAFKILEEKL